MKQFSGFLFIIFCFSSCYKDIATSKPPLTVEEFAPVLADIQLAESLLVDVRDHKEKDSLARAYYFQILQFHKITTQAFEQNMQLYMQSPELLKDLYTKVLEKLQTDEAAVNAKTRK